MTSRRPIEDRLWSRVAKSDGCWEWQGAFHKTGYGIISRAGERGYWLTHRVAWEVTNGPISIGACVLHHCDNRRCVRPSHLYVGDKKDNARDREARHRRDVRGERNGRAKLSETQVVEIRTRYANGGVTQKCLAEKFGVSKSHVSNLTRNAAFWPSAFDKAAGAWRSEALT